MLHCHSDTPGVSGTTTDRTWERWSHTQQVTPQKVWTLTLTQPVRPRQGRCGSFASPKGQVPPQCTQYLHPWRTAFGWMRETQWEAGTGGKGALCLPEWALGGNWLLKSVITKIYSCLGEGEVKRWLRRKYSNVVIYLVVRYSEKRLYLH